MERIELYRDEPNPNYGPVLRAQCKEQAWIREAQKAYAPENRIIRNVPVSDVIEPVFPNADERARFTQALGCISNQPDTTLLVGGREIRKMIGCTTIDIADSVAFHANNSLSDHDKLFLGHGAVEILKRYPTERMLEPDLDFFVDGGIELEDVQNHLKQQGFVSEIHEATGGVRLIEIKTETGTATFIKSSDSWQTREKHPWPLYCFQAKFTTDEDDKPVFKVDIAQARMTFVPLELPGLHNYPIDDPFRVTVVGRTLLLALTATDPNNKFLELPGNQTQNDIFDTVAELPRIFELPEEEQRQFGSGLRDNALALLLCRTGDFALAAQLLSDRDRAKLSPSERKRLERYEFFSQAAGTYTRNREQQNAA